MLIPFEKKSFNTSQFAIIFFNDGTMFSFPGSNRRPRWRTLTLGTRGARGGGGSGHSGGGRGLSLSWRRWGWKKLLPRALVRLVLTEGRAVPRGLTAVHAISVLTAPPIGRHRVVIHRMASWGHRSEFLYNPTGELFLIVMLLIYISTARTFRRLKDEMKQ